MGVSRRSLFLVTLLFVLPALLAVLLPAITTALQSPDGVDWRIRYFVHPLARATYYVCGMEHGRTFNRGLFEWSINMFQWMFEPSPFNDKEVRVIDMQVPASFCSAHTESTHTFTPADVPIRVWLPPSELANNSKLPVILWMHGGGFAIGSGFDAATHRVAKTFVQKGSFVVISVEYRLAPEYPFPHGIEDCYCVLNWLISEHQSHPLLRIIDMDRLVVAGESAGANYATVLTLMVRDRAAPVNIAHQLLLYPALFRQPYTRSAQKYEHAYILPRAVKTWFAHQYCLDKELLQHRYLSPMKTSLEGLPSAHIVVAEHDPLRDEGEEYYDALRNAGVPASFKCYDGMVHGFLSLPFLPAAHHTLHELVNDTINQLHAVESSRIDSSKLQQALS